MSDNDSKSRGGKTPGWTDREILVCLLNVMEYSDCKLDYSDAPYPPGRNASGFRQKINAIKRDLKGEFESIKGGNPVDGTLKKAAASGDGTSKPTSRKRKAKTDVEENGEDTGPKKRGRPKKNAAAAAAEIQEDIKKEINVKAEQEVETEIEAEI